MTDIQTDPATAKKLTDEVNKILSPKSVKLELTQKQLDMMVYMLGAIDLRTEPETLEVAMDLRKKLSNALEVFKPKNKPQLDKYGKPMSKKDIEEAQEVAALATPAQASEPTV